MPNSENNQAWSEEKSPSVGTAWFHNHYEKGKELFKNMEEPREWLGAEEGHLPKEGMHSLIKPEGN